MGSFRSGFAGVFGQTNVGKSTFLNAVLGTKLLITSDKPQATRNRVRCVYTDPEAQVVFVDTPGLHEPKNRLGRHLVREAMRALRGLDLLLFMVEPWRTVREEDATTLDRLQRSEVPILLLVNKIDRARGNDLEETLLAYEATKRFAELLPISSTRGAGLDEAMRTIKAYLPEGGLVFPPDVKTDAPEEFLLAEIIREKVYQRTFREIPYSTAVRVKWVHRGTSRKVEIQAEIVVARESQKGIIIGKRGTMIKEIGTDARTEIEALLGGPVFLELRVAVEPGWTQDEAEIVRLVGEGDGS